MNEFIYTVEAVFSDDKSLFYDLDGGATEWDTCANNEQLVFSLRVG